MRYVAALRADNNELKLKMERLERIVSNWQNGSGSGISYSHTQIADVQGLLDTQKRILDEPEYRASLVSRALYFTESNLFWDRISHYLHFLCVWQYQ
jgi:hypothetical protein